MPPGIGYPSTSTVQPKKDDQKQQMLRLAARIYARGGDDNDVASVFYNGYGVKLPGWEPKPVKDLESEMGKPGMVRGISMNAMDAITFGFGDEAIGSILGLVTEGNAQSGIDQYRKELQQFNTENPGVALASQVGGGLLMGGAGVARGMGRGIAAMSAPARAGASAGIGGAAGAAYGAGSASGGLSERAKGLVGGGVMGAVAGATMGLGGVPAVTLAGAGAGAVLNQDSPVTGMATGAAVGLGAAGLVKTGGKRGVDWLQRVVGMQKENRTIARSGRTLIAEALQRDFGSIDAAIAEARRLAATGANVTVADVGKENTGGLIQALAALRGPGKQKMVENLLSRQQEQGDRMLAGLFRSSKLGVQNAYDAADDLIALGKSASQPYYSKAYTQDVQLTDPIRKALQHPRLQRAYDLGRQIAFDEDYAGLPGSKATGAKEVPALAFDNAGRITNDVIPVRALDYMKRGLDSMIEKATDADAALLKQSGRALGSLMREAIDEAGAQVPDYATARTIFRGSREALEALEMGKGGASLSKGASSARFHTKPPEVVKRELAALPPQERQLYVLGALQDVAEMIGDIKAQAPNVAQKLGGKVYGDAIYSMEKRIRALFDSPDVAQDVMDYINAEARMSATAGRLGGSRTAPLAEEMAQVVGGPGAKGSIISQGAGATLRNMSNRIVTGWSEEISDELSSQALKGMNGSAELIAYLESLKPLARQFRVAPRVIAGQQTSKIAP